MIRKASASIPILAAALALGAGACSKDKQPALSPETTSGTITGQTFAVTDIFAVLQELHEGQVKKAKEAMEKATDPRVRAFAAEVVADQTERLQKQEQLMRALGVKPRENPVSERVKNITEREVSQLKSLSGPAFDRGYLDSEIAHFRMVLDTYDNDLIPNATDPQIKNQLVDGRMRINRFLETAQNLRGSLAAQAG